jgi:hypothetical protein
MVLIELFYVTLLSFFGLKDSNLFLRELEVQDCVMGSHLVCIPTKEKHNFYEGLCLFYSCQHRKILLRLTGKNFENAYKGEHRKKIYGFLILKNKKT